MQSALIAWLAVTGQLWVADQTADRVTAYATSDGSARASIEVELGAWPSAIAFDQKGRLWVANMNRHEIVRYGRDAQRAGGAISPEATLEQDLSFPISMAFDAKGQLWVLNAGTSLLTVYPSEALDGEGTLSASAIAEIVVYTASPERIIFDREGNLYVSDLLLAQLVKFAAADIAEPSYWTTAAAFIHSAQMLGPRALAFAPNGDCWVATFEGGLASLVRFQREQLAVQSAVQVIASARLNSDDLWGPSGIAFDERGDLWVASSERRTLQRFSAATLAAPGDRWVTPSAIFYADSPGLIEQSFVDLIYRRN